MEIEFDPEKDGANIARHGLSLADAGMLGLPGSAMIVDGRSDYGEVRYRAFGRIAGEGYCLAFTLRGTVLRPIGFRRAHEKEMRRYGQ
jgi:uncharacterized DUF497 family protein